MSFFRARNLLAFVVSALVFFAVSTSGQEHRAAAGNPPATHAVEPAVTAVDDHTPSGDETIIFLRHGEKPSQGLGQLTPQGLNRAIALSTVLPARFGKPDYLFAPDPAEKVSDRRRSFNYVRPLATIEPTAIALQMPVQTPCGFTEIDKLNEELTQPKYATSLIFVAWEHGYEDMAVKNLMKQFGGDSAAVPRWDEDDYDSLFVVKIHRAAGKSPTVTFTHDHEGLDHQSTSMPVAAVKPEH